MNKVLIDCIKIALQSEIPESKYHQFQYVRKGQIVGLCWHSLEYCWGQGIRPGWWYTVENSDEHYLLHELDVQPLEAEGRR